MASKQIKFLYLSQEDMIKAGVLDMGKCVDALDRMFKIMGNEDYLMGGPNGEQHGIRIYFPLTPRGPNMPVAGPDRRFMAMVGYLGGDINVCGEKWYGSNIENHKRALPRSILMITLNDPVTGAPLAIMDGTLVSAMRTGCIPGVGSKYLARKDSRIVGVIGTGVINRACLMSIACVLKGIKEVKTFDLIHARSEAFCGEMKNSLGLNAHPVNSLEEAIIGSDVVSLATSGPNPPVIKTEWLKEGAYIPVTGASASLGEDLLLSSRIVADNWKMHQTWRKEVDGLPPDMQSISGIIPHLKVHKMVETGHLRAEDIDSLGPISTGKRPGRTDDKKRIVLLTGGMVTEDIVWAYMVYKAAKEKGIGQELTLWNEPHWT
jgi:ornithine cyclodeaminase/alanine dehydrogenase-like protein (mu-crystallin family)